ncbi:MAG TPA: hypothetical protein VLR94_06385 [Acidobacteriota bacterium]|nr:hypothetical protein [Acidobacteriota bacterium]
MNIKSSLDHFKSRLSLFQVKGIRRGDRLLDLSLTDEDLLQDLTKHGTNDRLLERFTAQEVQGALEGHGVWKLLAEKGYPDPIVRIHSLDPFRQSVKIVSSPDAPDDDEHLLCEMRVFDAWMNGDCPLTGLPMEIDALVIDWLVFQNPHGVFTAERPRLPGQKYPGLGIMRTCTYAILDLARESGKEAVINIPEYYHNAVLYQPAFRFYSPMVEGRFLALQKLLAGLTLADASSLVASLSIYDDVNRKVLVWKPHEQVFGLVPRIVEYFQSPLYISKVREVEESCTFHFVRPADT